MTNLAGFLDSAARHLGRIFDKEVIQYIHLPAFLHTYWTSNCTHWSQNEHLLVWLFVDHFNTQMEGNFTAIIFVYYTTVATMSHILQIC